MNFSYQKSLAILCCSGWQFMVVGALCAQFATAEVKSTNPCRPVRGDSAIRLNFSDKGIYQNPLREHSASESLRPPLAPLRPHSSATSNRIERLTNRDARPKPNATVRLVHYQEDVDQDELTNSDDDLQLSEPDRDSELDGDLESDGDSEPAAEEYPAPPQVSTTNIRAPIRQNPFAEVRQYDPQGLLTKPLVDQQRFLVEKHSDISGRESTPMLATYNAHRLNHNPLYFEEPNLERYGNELEFQRVKSAVRFFSNAISLPLKASQLPPCSTVTTLGHRRPGEFVPYRLYDQRSLDAGRVQTRPLLRQPETHR